MMRVNKFVNKIALCKLQIEKQPPLQAIYQIIF